MSLPQRIDPSSVEVTGRDIPWKPFGTCEGFVYKILGVDVDRRLLVMGAYGHARVREIWLGGVTRDLLRHMTVPVLVSH